MVGAVRRNDGCVVDDGEPGIAGRDAEEKHHAAHNILKVPYLQSISPNPVTHHITCQTTYAQKVAAHSLLRNVQGRVQQALRSTASRKALRQNLQAFMTWLMTSPCFKRGRYCIPTAENRKIQIARKKRAEMIDGTAPMSVDIITCRHDFPHNTVHCAYHRGACECEPNVCAWCRVCVGACVRTKMCHRASEILLRAMQNP
jgi:hypothetical protein